MPKPIKCNPFEERLVIDTFADVATASKHESVFNSKSERFGSGALNSTYLNTTNNPGPQDYDTNADP